MFKLLTLQAKQIDTDANKNFINSNISIGCSGKSNVSLHFC
ncbi:class III lanthipeptide [Staphylococcus xylosus]